MVITDRDRKEWAHHPVTLEYLSTLKEARHDRLEAWAKGNYTHETQGGTIQVNAQAIGEVGVLTQLVDQIEELKALETGSEDIERVES